MRRIDFRNVVALAAAIGIAVSYCLALISDQSHAASEWPPDTVVTNASNTLINRRDSLDAIIQEALVSPYLMLSLLPNGDVRASTVSSEEPYVLEETDWSKYLAASGFRHLLNTSRTVSLTNFVDDEIWFDGIAFSYIYTWSDEPPGVECKAEFRASRCGVCAVRHDEKWTIEIAWVPADFSEWSEADRDACRNDLLSGTSDSTTSN